MMLVTRFFGSTTLTFFLACSVVLADSASDVLEEVEAEQNVASQTSFTHTPLSVAPSPEIDNQPIFPAPESNNVDNQPPMPVQHEVVPSVDGRVTETKTDQELAEAMFVKKYSGEYKPWTNLQLLSSDTMEEGCKMEVRKRKDVGRELDPQATVARADLQQTVTVVEDGQEKLIEVDVIQCDLHVKNSVHGHDFATNFALTEGETNRDVFKLQKYKGSDKLEVVNHMPNIFGF